MLDLIAAFHSLLHSWDFVRINFLWNRALTKERRIRGIIMALVSGHLISSRAALRHSKTHPCPRSTWMRRAGKLLNNTLRKTHTHMRAHTCWELNKYRGTKSYKQTNRWHQLRDYGEHVGSELVHTNALDRCNLLQLKHRHKEISIHSMLCFPSFILVWICTAWVSALPSGIYIHCTLCRGWDGGQTLPYLNYNNTYLLKVG